jgi:hypothetical protein
VRKVSPRMLARAPATADLLEGAYDIEPHSHRMFNGGAMSGGAG